MSKKLSEEQVEHIAQLARIGISKEEKTRFQEELGTILDYVDKLQEANVDNVEPTSHITGLENQTREDENGSTHSDPKTLLDMAPDEKDGYVKVRQVLNK